MHAYVNQCVYYIVMIQSLVIQHIKKTTAPRLFHTFSKFANNKYYFNVTVIYLIEEAFIVYNNIYACLPFYIGIEALGYTI